MIDVRMPRAFREIHKPYRYKIFYGGRGSAKSQTVARYLLLAGKQEKMRILCCREFQTSIKDSVKQLLEDLIVEMELSDFYKVQTTEIRGANGTSFVFAGLHHNIANIKSMHDVKKCWVEEAQVVSDASWKILIPTIRAEGSEIILTLNPDLEDDPTYQRFIVKTPPNALKVMVNYQQNTYFPEVLRLEMEYDKEEDYQSYLNIWEGHCKAAVEGAIYAEYLERAKAQDRIGDFSYDDRYPVSCFWDIGWNDHTSIVFLQFVNHEPRVILSYQNQFQKTPHYIGVLNDTKFRFDRIVLPHDAENEHGDAEKTWLQQVQHAFPNCNVYAGERRPVEVRLEAVKNVFDALRFHRDGTTDLLAALARYHFAIDPVTQRQTREPFHGPESNYADAFGYMALEMLPPKKKKEARKRSIYVTQ